MQYSVVISRIECNRAATTDGRPTDTGGFAKASTAALQSLLRRTSTGFGGWPPWTSKRSKMNQGFTNREHSCHGVCISTSRIGFNEAHITGLLVEAFCLEYVHCLYIPISTKAKERSKKSNNGIHEKYARAMVPSKE